MAMRVLALGTYPTVKPIHGGQRRVAAFRRFYEEDCKSIYHYVCIYDALHYSKRDVGSDDWPLIVPPSKVGLSSLIGDMLSGRQHETDSRTLDHFANVIERVKPDALQLEQPFMWPLAKTLRRMYGGQKLRLIYSSHNVESVLKSEILTSWSVTRDLRRSICAEIDRIEEDLCREADLIVCVSSRDREHYCQYQSPADVVVVPNGVDRPASRSRYWANGIVSRNFGARRFVMTVGSGYPPNVDGVCHYLVTGGMFCLPPAPSIAVCGGMAAPLFQHPEFRRYVAANSTRVRLFATIDDDNLSALKQSCHGVLLPLRTGGGSNLKTAEALALGKWTVATPTALRGFEAFADAEGVVVAADPASFRRGMQTILQREPIQISAASRASREALYWDRCFADSGLAKSLLS